MAYCKPEDVQADFKNITFDSNSSVTDCEVQAIADQESAYIDSMISSLYAVPISKDTSPRAFAVLKRICVFLCSDRVRHILYTKTGQEAKDQDTKGTYSLSRDPKRDLKMIQDGTLRLIDAQALETLIGFDSGADDLCCDPVFTKCRDQW